MSEMRPVCGIDVGSSTVSVVVGTCDGEQLEVLGCGQARHDGARKGVVASLDEVSEAVRVAAEEAEAMASVPVEEAVVGIGGMPVIGRPSTASVPVTGRDHTVSEDDVRRALQASAGGEHSGFEGHALKIRTSENRIVGVARRPLQHIRFGLLQGKGQSGKDVGDQVDPEKLDGGQRRTQPHHEGHPGQHDLA